MKKPICFLVHTEYHLLLSINSIIQNYSNESEYEITLILKRTSKSTRLKQDLDLTFLPYTIMILDFDMNLNNKLSLTEKESINSLLAIQFDVFIFFQEQDPISIIIMNEYKTKGTKIYLFQDGLKPYIAHSMSFSPMLLVNNIKQNRWIKKNGYPINDYFSFINCKMYAFIKGIDKLFLTFPEFYINWNKLPIEQADINFNQGFISLMKRIFNWQESLLKDRNGVIFYMNQPMHDDGSFEVKILEHLQIRYPNAPIYIKNHPLTSKVKLESYKVLNNVTIIDSKIPAELFISMLEKSIILSVCSTSMFIDNPLCKFYYMFEIEQDNNIERLKKYTVINPTPHVRSVKNIDEISF